MCFCICSVSCWQLECSHSIQLSCVCLGCEHSSCLRACMWMHVASENTSWQVVLIFFAVFYLWAVQEAVELYSFITRHGKSSDTSEIYAHTHWSLILYTQSHSQSSEALSSLHGVLAAGTKCNRDECCSARHVKDSPLLWQQPINVPAVLMAEPGGGSRIHGFVEQPRRGKTFTCLINHTCLRPL